ncbi:MAG: hypothetical protein IJK06_01445 [Clostridia bacterium]|nr:hypothetical protein [Clostridia bacterium]
MKIIAGRSGWNSFRLMAAGYVICACMLSPNRILIPLMGAEMRLTGRRLHVLRDDRKKSNHPIIFCPTHIGSVDIEMPFLAVKDPCWLVLGNPRELYKDVNGMMLQMNGWIPLDILHKSDRTAAKAQKTALLKKG